jgi:hypothetical protein
VEGDPHGVVRAQWLDQAIAARELVALDPQGAEQAVEDDPGQPPKMHTAPSATRATQGRNLFQEGRNSSSKQAAAHNQKTAGVPMLISRSGITQAACCSLGSGADWIA